MRNACLLPPIAAIAAAATGVAASPASDAGAQPRFNFGFATVNSDSTINGDVEAKLGCEGVLFDVRFSTNIKHAADAEQAQARAVPILTQAFRPYQDFCRSPAPRLPDRDFGGGMKSTRTGLHVTGASMDGQGVSGALAITVSCAALTTEVRVPFSGARTKQDAVDQTRDGLERQAKALQPYCGA